MILKMTLKWTALLGVVLLAAQAFGGEQQILNNQKDKENYSTGVEFVRNLKQQGGAVDLDIVIQGIKDGLTGEKLLMTEEDIRRILAAIQEEMTARQKQAANQRDKTRSTSADAGQNSEPAVPQRQDRPEQGDDQFQSNAMFAKKEARAQKTAQDGRNGQVQPMQAPISVAERGQNRNAIKLRGLELRRQTIEQELR